MHLDEPIPGPLRELLDKLMELWDSIAVTDGIPVAEVMEELRDMLDRDDT